jgi:DNA-binding response OmpR family regulator
MSQPLILIAEGQQDVRTRVRESLEQSGFRALAAASPADVWRVMKTTNVGVVVLDTGMRGPDGMDLCRDVRAATDAPIILVGAQSTEVDRVVGLELGADDYLSKPYSPRELAARLRAVLRRGRNERAAGAARPNRICVEGWDIDFTRHQVRDPSGGLVDLTSAEFALLGILLDHPQRVVSRARMLELTGIRSAASSDRSIDVLVSRLRRKLTGASGSLPITTVRGAGYMIGAPVEMSR